MNNIKEMLDSMLKGIPEYHADAAIFYSPVNGWPNAWSVHIGNPCPAVALGEISGIYVGNGVPARLIGDHLVVIAKENNISHWAVSETHLLSIIQDEGIEVQLLDSDGSKLDY